MSWSFAAMSSINCSVAGSKQVTGPTRRGPCRQVAGGDSRRQAPVLAFPRLALPPAITASACKAIASEGRPLQLASLAVAFVISARSCKQSFTHQTTCVYVCWLPGVRGIGNATGSENVRVAQAGGCCKWRRGC